MTNRDTLPGAAVPRLAQRSRLAGWPTEQPV